MRRNLLFVFLLLCSGAAWGGSWSDTLTGDWGGARQTLFEHGVQVSAGYQSDFAANLSGGERKTSAYAGQWNLGFDFDFNRMLHWSGGSVHIMMTKRNGSGIENRAGITSYDTIQQLFGTGSVTRLFRFYLQQSAFDDKLTLQYGRMDYGMDFFLFGCDFMAHIFCGNDSSHIGKDIMNWPRAETGGVVMYRPNHAWTLKFSRFKVNPNNAREAFFFRPDGPTAGHLYGAEVDLQTELDSSTQGALKGSWAVGGWRDTAPHPDVFLASNGMPLVLADGMDAMVRSSNGGAYVLGRQEVTSNGRGGGIVLMGSVVESSATVNAIDQEAVLAAEWVGPFAARPRDKLGLAFGSVRTSSHAAMAVRVANAADGTDYEVPGRQYNTELHYTVHVWRGFWVMPNIQYILHPAGQQRLHDVLVFGTEITAKL